ncbi:NAD(P)-binding protein [Rhizodiscina lignyota]|uniref:NAD(P)-binding protein n=1 Tax=Rhizodiscina lignyota TaxID=1504668 RepID=A0A9P4IS36_9PEZI|nr:NAD(P)-binding protein [Rhizodiscina lignyota]
MSLTNKVAIVTGGSRGIGAGIAKELAHRGAKVLLTFASTAAAADSVVQDIKSAGGEAVALKADCMDKDTPALVIKTAVESFDGGIDIIINNAAAGDECYLKDVTYEHYEKVFTTNVRFPMFLVKESLPFLRRGGRIVNIGSVVSREGWKMHTAYGATKACMDSFARTWSVELGHEYGITVNNVNPGPVNTDMWTEMPQELLDQFDPYINSTPAAPRVGEVDDIVPIVAFLCEEGARWITGSTTCANGGKVFT